MAVYIEYTNEVIFSDNIPQNMNLKSDTKWTSKLDLRNFYGSQLALVQKCKI